MISGDSYIRRIPSAAHVDKNNPMFFGVNRTSVTDVLESTRLALRTHCLPPLSFKIFVSTTDAITKSIQIIHAYGRLVRSYTYLFLPKWKQFDRKNK